MAAMTDSRVHRVSRIPRDVFLRDYWRYEPGEHVTVIGKTGSGKTYLSFELLGASISPKLPGVVLVMKPRDETVDRWQRRLKLKRIATWPPPLVRRYYEPPRGWVLWPKLGDLDRDDIVLRREFEKCFKESYAQAARKNGQPRAIFADEIVGVSKDLGLERQVKGLWMRGRSVGIGVWAATQRPFDAPLLAYQAAEHLFLAAEPDDRNRKRLAEIGGFDSRLLEQLVHPDSRLLRQHEFLYLGRSNHVMAIIGA